ncbi:MBL fold metallo-hydrolase [Cryptosporangium phraense]|uniref:MBL fold metallo-hydrolase n=1 Tax=Cryptosporangium phraense TaxID=2593070 RepID=A0A545B040_9ACTN|nr:MBL fold metallo-hydrolase [Cryptosporangium phraense]TQS46942.1 MBL fold metallo-hydrolase [Cryptosporangium phraense]
MIDFETSAPATGLLDIDWNHDDPIQVHAYDEHTVVLRQSKKVHYEAPFMFLLFGNERALLLDTGATADSPLRATVDRLIETWRQAHPRETYGLVVAHTHGHGDHVAGDDQFRDRPDTTVVSADLAEVRAYFGLPEEPGAEVPFDLGGRVLTLLASPGHHRASVTVHDPWTGILFTGDTVLPGRLYIEDTDAYLASIRRLVALADATRVTHVVGCHIEMTSRPGRDYPLGATHQPDEHALAMTPADLRAIRDAVEAHATRRGVYRYPDFIVYNRPPVPRMLALVARGLVRKTFHLGQRRAATAWRRRQNSASGQRSSAA